jgi:hypothetical protein
VSLCNHAILDQLKTYLIKSNFGNVQSMRKGLSVVKRFSGRGVEEVNDLLVVLIPDGDGVGTYRDLIKIHSFLSFSLFFIFLSFYLSVFLSLCLPVFMPFCLSAFLPLCLSTFVSFCLCVFLSLCLSLLSISVSQCLCLSFSVSLSLPLLIPFLRKC